MSVPWAVTPGALGELAALGVPIMSETPPAPATLELVRRDAGRDGNLEGLFHAGIAAAADWLYRNPYAPARLTDDEVAIATCLDAMAAFVDGGPGFCSLAEAAHDHCLNLMMGRAAERGVPIRAPGLEWVAALARE